MPLSAYEAMQLAIEHGKKGAGLVSPNPLVGCVILDKNFELIGAGHHALYGGPHAEINAINSVKDKSALQGAHLFVTLEPCAHEGKTPSCAKALAKLSLASVTFGLIDPNPLVAGQGQKILQEANVKTEKFNELKEELEELSEIFLHSMRTQTPFVALKVAASLDGQIALQNGESRWITGESARQHVQYLRGCFDAVLVGANTVLKDNPRLNARDPRFAEKKSKVVIFDPDGRSFSFLKDSALLKVRAAENVVLVVKPGVANDLGCVTIEADLDASGNFDLSQVLQKLFHLGLRSVLVEGGAQVVSSFLNQRRAQRVFLFLAPKVLGRGLAWSSGFSIDRLEDALQLVRPKVTSIGTDLLVSGLLASRG